MTDRPVRKADLYAEIELLESRNGDLRRRIEDLTERLATANRNLLYLMEEHGKCITKMAQEERLARDRAASPSHPDTMIGRVQSTESGVPD